MPELSPSPDPESRSDLTASLQVGLARLNRTLRRRQVGFLTPSQLSALASITQHGPITMGRLAEIECVAPSTLTALLKRLEREKLVKRRANTEDRRSSLLEATKAGDNVVRQVRIGVAAFLSEKIDTLSPFEQKQLRDILPVLTKLADA